MNDTAQTQMIDAHIASLAANGRKWIEAQAAELKDGIARQHKAKTNYDMGALVECMEGQLSRLRKAWKVAK